MEDYTKFIEDKIIEYDKELQRIAEEYDKLELKYEKLKKELIESRFKQNAKQTISSKCQSKEVSE